MHAYPHYRDSGVEWLGEVPEHWEVRRLKDVGRLIAGAAFPEALQGVEGEALPFFKVGDLDRSSDGRWLARSDHTISRETAAEIRARVIPRESVVYAKIGAALLLNRRRVTTGPSCIDNNMSAYVPNRDQVTTNWALYTLSLIDFGEHVNPGAVPSLSEGDQAILPVPLPPLDEQRAIAAYLDRETERIDALVAKKRLLIERLEEYRTALITRTVTRGLPPEAARAAGLDPSPRLKPSGVEWLGEVPEHWEVKELKRCVPGITVGIVVTPSKYYEDEGVPCLRSLNVLPGRLTGTELVYISDESNELHRKSMIFEGDVVAVRSGRPGTAAVVDERFDGANAIDLIIIRRSDQLRSDFLVYGFGSSMVSRQVALGSEGAVQEHFNIESVKRLVITVPPPEEQDCLVAYLDQETSALSALVARTETAIERLQEYRTALITATVTGKIDVRE